jgi:hypothetical protein
MGMTKEPQVNVQAQFEFYRRCTPEFTADYMRQMEEFLTWVSERA